MNVWIPTDSKRHASIARAKQRLKDSLPGTLDKDLHMLHAAQEAACSANEEVYESNRSDTQIWLFNLLSNKHML